MEKLWHGLVVFVNTFKSTKNDFAWLESPGGHLAAMITRRTHIILHMDLYSFSCLFYIFWRPLRQPRPTKDRQYSNRHFVSKQIRDQKAYGVLCHFSDTYQQKPFLRAKQIEPLLQMLTFLN